MSAGSARRELADLVLQLKGLVHVRALLESRGASTAEVTEHSEAIERVRSQLARLAKDSNGAADGASLSSAGGRR
jgi:hypothetical protein